jgi:hypothetical protein
VRKEGGIGVVEAVVAWVDSDDLAGQRPRLV